MASKRISQREARRLRKQVEALRGIIRRQRLAWSQEYVRGVQICSIESHHFIDVIRTARKLKHAVVAVPDDTGGYIRMVALPHPSEDI